MKYKKDFNGWNSYKKYLNASRRDIDFHEGEIWWCSIGINVGTEEDGKGINYQRPVLIYFKREATKEFFGIPFTTSKQMDENFTEKTIIDGKIVYALLGQGRTLSIKRLGTRIGIISDVVFDNIISKMDGLKPKRALKQQK